MVETFQNALQYVCVSALAAIVLCAALTFVAEKGRRILSRFRSVTLAVWLCIAAASSVILGSDKTNGLLQAILPFGPQIQVVQLPQVQPVVPPPVPRISAPSPRASADMPFRARAWNRRGAWDDSFRCAFPGEWVFPHGTGHLDRVEVCSQGRILPRYGSTNVMEGGGAHEYTVNPCGVGIGRVGHFRVEVTPDSFPDDRIVWEKTDGLEFVGPCTGRCVSVRGVSEGIETLTVKVGDCRSDAPTFDVEVVQNVTVNLRAWIIEDSNNQKPIEVVDVRRMVKKASDIYAQVGVTLNLIEPIVVTNIPNAYNALCETPMNPTETWSFEQIVDIGSNTGGLELYFINRFTDSDDTLAANSRKGIVVTRDADFRVLAHEIGHAFGMRDIYASSGRSDNPDATLVTLSSCDTASFSHMRNDWNGGCHGKGAGGARYYRYNTKMADVLPRMLMNGRYKGSDNPIDITSGDIYGVYYTYDENHEKVWHKDDAPTAFPFGYRNITHQ